MSNFVVTCEIDRNQSPDQTLEYVVYGIDQGGLGIDFSLYIEKDFYGLMSVQRRLALIDNPKDIEWIDNRKIKVGRETIKLRWLSNTLN